MEKHKIDWLNMPGYKGETWNPIIGCIKVSAGCKNCYAEKMAGRLANISSSTGQNTWYRHVVKIDDVWKKRQEGEQLKFLQKWNGQTHFVESALDKPLHWKKPRMIFVCSMSDLFHETTPYSQITQVINTIQACPQHIFILLTKRPEVMRDYFSKNPPLPFGILPNIWLGVTAENQETANERIPILLDIPAAKRFVSIEPMLSDVKLIQSYVDYLNGWNTEIYRNSKGENEPMQCHTEKLDWVICGGESGHNARPMHPDWVRSIKYQCKDANTPFFFKQWGEWEKVGICGYPVDDKKYYDHPKSIRINIEGGMGFHGESAIYMMKKGRSKTGSELDGNHYKEFPV